MSRNLQLMAGGLALALLLGACGGGGGGGSVGNSGSGVAGSQSAAAQNPLPSISSLTPGTITAGSPAFTLAIQGSDFVAGSTVIVNGESLQTTFVSASKLTASVPAAVSTAVDGSTTVTVVTPGPGGGTSNAAALAVTTTNPVPSISGLAPAIAAAGGAGFTVKVNGSDFVTTSSIAWNGTVLTTTYVSAAQLTAAVPSALLASPGTPAITVLNPAPGGGISNTATFTLTTINPAPSIASISPSSVAAGSPAFTLTVTGSDFVAASTIAWNGAALATTYVGASQLTAQVPAADVASAGTPSITVATPAPGGGASNAVPFTVGTVNPAPAIATLAPAIAAAGSTAVTLTVSGSDFVPASTVEWNGASLATSYVSAAQLSALVPASDLTGAGTASVSVLTPAPGGGISNAARFSIDTVNPVPSIATLSPASAAAGGTAVTLVVNGGNFVAASTVQWNGAALATTYVSASQLSALVPASDLATTGSAAVTVATPNPGGGRSTAVAFTIQGANAVPSLASLSPTNAAAGSAAMTLTVNGGNFAAAATVEWNGVALTTTYVSATQLTARVPASDLASTTTASVTVVNPTPGGGTSGSLTFTVNSLNPVPSIASLSPASAAAGSPPLTLTVNGGGFVPASTIDWNGAALATTYVNATQLSALVPASDLASATTAGVTVVNAAPGGGTSGVAGFAVGVVPPSSGYIRQYGQYTAYPGSTSNNWNVTLTNVLPGSTIYVIGTWPNFSSPYPTMAVTDGVNRYTELDRYADTNFLSLGIKGTQTLAHWYAANVAGGTYTVNMAPTPYTWEDYAAVIAFEVAGVSATPLAGHALNFQAAVPPGSNSVAATVTVTGSGGVLIALAFDDVAATPPTMPLTGAGFTAVLTSGTLWDFTKTGKPSASAEYAHVSGTGAQTATFSPQETGAQLPDYMTTAVVLH